MLKSIHLIFLSLVIHLIFTVQALSKRIHYGKFVAEAKFQESPDSYEPAIRAQVSVLLALIGIVIVPVFSFPPKLVYCAYFSGW